MSCFRKPDRPSPFALHSKFLLPQFAFGKNLRSVSQAPFRLHSVVSVQRQHDRTGVQINHTFYPVYVPRLTVPVFSEMLRYKRWLIKFKCNSAIQYLQLFFLKSQIEKSIIFPAVYEQKIIPKYGEIQASFVVNKHVVLSDSLFAT